MNRRAIRHAAVALVLLTPALLSGRQAAPPAPTAAGDMVDRIFKTREFSARPAAPPSGSTAAPRTRASNPCRTATARCRSSSTTAPRRPQREVLITAAQLTPPGAASPLEVEDLSWSADGQRVLIFTNTRRVWRTNSRGDYWLLDRQAGRLKKLGGDVPEASLLYAQFNPGATKVAYVRQNDLYVEDLASGAITRLTRDGSDLVINGGADWVNEEELDLHDCFRWSPDGTRIAFWQFDLRGVGNFPLTYYLGKERDIVTQLPYPQPGPYPAVMSVPYPLAGTTNSAVRVGVVETKGGAVRWMQLPGEPREHYIARLQWADARTLLVQQLNRLQNTARYLLAEPRADRCARCGATTTTRSSRSASAGCRRHGRSPAATSFLVTSEKDGWMHVYRVSREGRRNAGDAWSVRRDRRGRRRRRESDRCMSWRRLRMPRSAICTAPRSTVRAIPSASRRRSSPARTPTRSRRTDDSPFTGTRASTIPASASSSRCRSTSRCAMIDDNAALKQKVARAAQAAGRVLQGGRRGRCAWSMATCSSRPTSTPRSDIPSSSTSTASRPARRSKIAGAGPPPSITAISPASDTSSSASTIRERRRRAAARGARRSTARSACCPRSSRPRRSARWRRPGRMSISIASAVWGWSGGGTNTLNLMFRSPELYKVGMSVAPVPDQRLYDTIYQERYMGLPAGNTEGYKQASAINFAEGLSGNLLIVHGSGDDNVHYQGTELLVNRLIELGKPFDFMTYPDRTPCHLGRPRNDAAPLSPADALSHDAPARRPAGSVAVADSAGADGCASASDAADPGSEHARIRPGKGTARRHAAAGRRGRQLHHRPDAHSGAGDDGARRRSARHGPQLHDELDRQQDLSGHRARCRHLRHAGSQRSGEARRDDQPSRALHAPRRRLRARSSTSPAPRRRSSSAPTGPIRCSSPRSTT